MPSYQWFANDWVFVGAGWSVLHDKCPEFGTIISPNRDQYRIPPTLFAIVLSINNPMRVQREQMALCGSLCGSLFLAMGAGYDVDRDLG